MNSRAFPDYVPHEIETRRQTSWRERDVFRTPDPAEDKPSRYIKPSAPFTSGNIHIGHVRSYSIGDAYARFWRARGENVLFAFGFDSFGLPAELGAIAGKVSPESWVSRCAEHMTGQLERLGFSFDWERAFMSSDPIMYRWSQWLFLTLMDAGLVYRGTGTVDWCDTCQTTLATIQVEDGRCWRCHNPVRLTEREQWYLRISTYLEENDQHVRELAESGIWDENALASQRFVLGRVDGVELELASNGRALTVFTPHGDALGSARFIALSPRHPDIELWIAGSELEARLEEMRSSGIERSEREVQGMSLLDTGFTLPSPSGGEPLPVIVTTAVDGRFGATAVLGIPARDRTDAAIAERLFGSVDGDGDGSNTGADTPSTTTTAATSRAAVRYKASDFTISRQRSWGTPIPIVYCDSCGTVPVPREQLPVLLPRDLKPTGEGNPLAEREDFVNTACPSCGGQARRETDTLDCHFDALWLWVPVCVPPSERSRTLEEILALQDLRSWLPCERVVAGSDSGNFVFDQRTVAKALRDIGPMSFLGEGEPFAGCLFHEMVIADGRKMSKHLGNVVDPDDLVERYGADTVRLAVLYAARPQRALNWSDSAVQHCHRFLHQLWRYAIERLGEAGDAHSQAARGDGVAEDGGTDGQGGTSIGEMGPDKTEHLRNRLAKWCDIAVEKITEDLEQLQMHSAVRNVMRMFDRIRDYESRVVAKRGSLCVEDTDALVGALTMLAIVLTPFAPHIAEELLIAAGEDPSRAQMSWPSLSSKVAA